MKAKFVDSVGCIIEGDFNKSELDDFISKDNGWDCVWYFNKDWDCYRYPKTDRKDIKELQECKFREVSGKGSKSCITDLFINAGY